MQKLTVLIPCKDEVHNIDACIDAALLIADEVLVADSGSTDGTVERVRKRGDCRLIEREFINYSSFKNWAIPHATHEWVLIVDADERVTAELASEIRSILASDTKLDAYTVPRTTYMLGYRLRYSGLQHDRATRLIKQSLRYADTRVHEHLNVAPYRVGDLTSRLEHHTVQSLSRMFAVQNRYTSWAALDRHDRGKRARFWQVAITPPFKFFQTYILQRGFLDGRMGFAWSAVTAYYAFARLLKQWELDHSRYANSDRAADIRDDAASQTSRRVAA